jgi:signal transduction histidine kinase
MEGRGILKVETKIEEHSAIVQITDSGGGIPSDVLPHIFEPFFTTKPPGEGSGLGLSITRTIIEKHSGHIEVDSQPGLTKFTIRLPLTTSNLFQTENRTPQAV